MTLASEHGISKITIDPDSVIGEINPCIYGHFIEHVGKCIYGGILRGDDFDQKVLELVKGLKPPILRWPGGNFASGYHWTDGIGPVGNRPRMLDLAWHAIDPNTFGTDEFIELCHILQTEPYICVNMGSGNAEEASGWVEYCNSPCGSYHSDLRKRNGHETPYGVKFWGLGNEVYGDWQIGHCDAKTYAINAAEFSKRMKWVDPSIKTVAVGCDDVQWNWDVLKVAGRYIDYISLHKYYYNPEYLERVAAPLEAEKALKRLAATILAATGEARIKVAFDEWNLWYPESKIENGFTQKPRLTDAIFAAGIFNALHRLCRDVQMACLAQLVNVLPLILADEASANTTPPYFVFELYRQHAGRFALRVDSDGEVYTSKAWGEPFQVPFVDVSATKDGETEGLTLFIVNRDNDRQHRCQMRIKGLERKMDAVSYELTSKEVEGHDIQITKREDMILSPLFDHVVPPHSITIIRSTIS